MLRSEYVADGGFLGSTEGFAVGSQVVSGIPVKARVEFKKVRQEMLEAKLIELGCSSDAGDFNVQFRDVPITRP